MKILKEICYACPQDLVVELDNGERYNFYIRHGHARLYDESGTEALVGRDVFDDDVGWLPLEEVAVLVTSMAAEYNGERPSTCPHCGGAL